MVCDRVCDQYERIIHTIRKEYSYTLMKSVPTFALGAKTHPLVKLDKSRVAKCCHNLHAVTSLHEI